jgi:hypothetical protein
MKFKKMFVQVLVVLTFFVSAFNLSATTKPALFKKSHVKDFLKTAYSNYVHYQEIDGKIWVIIYSNEGVELERYPLD